MQTTSIRHPHGEAFRQILRPMQVGDIAQVMEVEQQSFPTMWPATAFKRELERNRLARYLAVVERRPQAPRVGLATPVAPRSGFGRFLGGLRHVLAGDGVLPPPEERRELVVIAAIETALRERQSVVTLECRVSNAAALRLYAKYGFQQVGLRRCYYSDNKEDAYILTADGIGTPSYGRRFQRLRDEHRERWGEYELSL
jgi:ribosomal-protein-alanine N-acetyltransferase